MIIFKLQEEEEEEQFKTKLCSHCWLHIQHKVFFFLFEVENHLDSAYYTHSKSYVEGMRDAEGRKPENEEEDTE